MAVVSYGKQNMNRVKICEIMELVGVLRKKRMKKGLFAKNYSSLLVQTGGKIDAPLR